MTELFTDTVLNMMTTTAEPEDYTGEDGLLYCGKCRTAKEAYFPKETAAWLGHDKHPTECDCQREKRLECESAEERRRHLDTVMELKRRGFTDLTMQEWTFAHDNGKCPQMSKAHLYVEHWEQMRENNYGLLLWGKVGTGKSYFAGCIANALMEQEISVRMTNFSAILNDLTASFEGRNEYIERLFHLVLFLWPTCWGGFPEGWGLCTPHPLGYPNTRTDFYYIYKAIFRPYLVRIAAIFRNTEVRTDL